MTTDEGAVPRVLRDWDFLDWGYDPHLGSSKGAPSSSTEPLLGGV